jgi:hypothetical protein
MEAEIGNAEIDTDFYIALGELFRRGRLDKHYTGDYHAVEHLCLTLRLILDNVERVSFAAKVSQIMEAF